MKNKKLLKISFFLLLIVLFTFLEWQIDKEVEKIEPVSHIAVGRWLDVKNSYIYSYILNNLKNFIYSSMS